MVDYTGSWEGQIPDSNTFNFIVEIEYLQSTNSVFKIYNHQNIITQSFKTVTPQAITISLAENLSFNGVVSENGAEINGFIKSGILLYHIKLTKSNSNTFIGNWNILMVDKLKSQNFYLSIENGSQDNYQAFPILTDNRFTGTWCGNFHKQNDTISFSDFKTGLQFKGGLQSNKIALEIFLGNNFITKIDLEQSSNDWIIGEFVAKSDKNPNTQFLEMETHILNDSFPNTHSVLISRNGKLLYEQYFNGYHKNIPHDTRSASKSISSAIVGIANDQSLFENIEQPVFNYIPENYQVYKDSLNSRIDIKSLLTMSSGLDADDYTRKRKSPASEDSYQNSPDWLKTVLTAPMINRPNTVANYGSANPYLLGIAMGHIVPEPLALFMDKNLFQKLEISNYIIQTDLDGNPYFGGGMYLTSRDLIKFGELYLNNGILNSKRILSTQWVKNSLKNYLILENVPDKNGYGYLWWHNTYQINGNTIETVEARGNGGQYIFIIPSLKTVVVITSGNYGNRKTQQPESILERYILSNLKN